VKIRWAMTLAFEHCGAAAELRQCAGVEVCRVGDVFWVLGGGGGGAGGGGQGREAREMAGRIACLERYEVGADDLLTPEGRKVPVGRLPGGPWTAIAQWFEVQAPVWALPGEHAEGERVALRLVRGEQESEATAMVVAWGVWVAWVEEAAEVRLARLMFAVSERLRTETEHPHPNPLPEGEGVRVFVKGTPLPNVVGRRYVEEHGVALPAGWRLEPSLPAGDVMRMLGGGQSDIAVFDEGGGYEWIGAGALMPVSRAVVREMNEVRHER
jgi:hypothetical protein